MLPEKTSHQKAYLAVAWVSFSWGTTWLASRIGVAHMPPLQFIAFRQFFGGLLFVIYFLMKKHPLPKGKQWGVILILSALNFMVSNGFVIWGMKFISSGLGAIIAAMFPLWLVIITMFKGKKLASQAMLGMLLGFGGVCIIFYDHLKDFLNADFRFGIFISLIASITWAFGALYTQRHAGKESFNPYYSIGIQMIISSFVFFGFSYGSGNTIPFSAIPMPSFWALVYLVFIGSGVTFIAYIYALKNLSASLTSVYAYINPIVAVLLGAAVLNEKLNMYIAAGGLVAITGVILVNNSFRKKIE